MIALSKLDLNNNTRQISVINDPDLNALPISMHCALILNGLVNLSFCIHYTT